MADTAVQPHPNLSLSAPGLSWSGKHDKQDRIAEWEAHRWVVNPKMNGIQRGFGLCILRQVVNRQGATMAAGELASFLALESVANQTGASADKVVKSGSFSAEYEGRIIVVDVAGAAAPEGESARVVAADSDNLYLSPSLSAALENGDDIDIITMNDVHDAAAGDDVMEVAGILMDALQDNRWGWVVARGLVRDAVTAGNDLTADKGIIAGTAAVDVSSTSGENLIIGHSIVTVGAGPSLAPVYIDVVGGAKNQVSA